MSTRPDTLRRIRTQQYARHNPRHSPAETRTAVVVKPASVKRLRAHPSGAKGAAREAALRPRHVVHVPSTSHPCSPKGGIPGGVFGRRYRGGSEENEGITRGEQNIMFGPYSF